MSLITQNEPKLGISPGIFESPQFPRASSTCKLKFWLYKIASGGSFNAFLNSDNTNIATLYRQNPYTQTSNWTEVAIDVGSVYKEFKIVFEASKPFNQRGVFSIDDISFQDCALPFVAANMTCMANQTRCKRGNCVDNDRICDFVDDCGGELAYLGFFRRFVLF